MKSEEQIEEQNKDEEKKIEQSPTNPPEGNDV